MRFLSGFFLWIAVGLIVPGITPDLVAQAVLLPRAEELTERQGLPQAFVSSIIQDQKGFIWMATRDGLCRYDGQRFRVFQVSLSGENALSFPDVLQSNSRPTRPTSGFKSEHNKMDRLDPTSETFRNITLEPFYRRHFGRDTLWDLFPDSRNRVWLLFCVIMDWFAGIYGPTSFRRFRHTRPAPFTQ
jgi:ligand-binding sensor domain-containing protein